MNVKRIQFLGIFVALLCFLAAKNSEGNRKLAQSFSEKRDSLDVIEIDDVTVELVLRYCRKELEESTEDVNDDAEFDSTIKKTIADLPLNNKKTILNCLREKNIPLHRSRPEQEAWLNKYQTLFSDWASVPRRYLRRKRRGHRAIRIAPSPGPALSPGFSASTLSNFANPSHQHISLTPSAVSQPPVEPPVPSPSLDHLKSPSQSPSPALNHLSPPPTRSPYPSDDHIVHPLPVLGSFPPEKISPISPDNNEKHMKSVGVIVSSVSAGVTMVALFLLCCLKKRINKIEPKDGQRDEKRHEKRHEKRDEKRNEKPLLNLFVNDVSAGSSEKPQIVSSSEKPQIVNNPNGVTASLTVNNSWVAKGESQSSEAGLQSFENTTASLPLPPGMRPPPPPPLPPRTPPPPSPPKPPSPAAPPPPKSTRPPPNPPKPFPLGPHHRGRSSMSNSSEISDESEAHKKKLKPFFWDKVLANPDHSMVWDEVRAGSFQFNEEMIESLFGYTQADKNKHGYNKDSPSGESPPQLIQIIDPKKSQNLAILLKALNVTTEEVCDALKEGNELPAELIQTLLKMAPTSDEELKLRLYVGDLSNLGPAERFLKVIVEIPFAFKRLESLLFMTTCQEEVSSTKESLATLEVACKELRNSRLFMKLLEAVLKTGNRMNDGTYRGGAQAFKLDTLLKLSDVKGTDGKTTLLHFVVLEIIRSEGQRAARRLKEEDQSTANMKTEDLIEDSAQETEEYHRTLGLQVVSGLSNELENVKKAALIDNECLIESVSKLRKSVKNTCNFLDTEMKSLEEEGEFYETLVSFVDEAESDVRWLTEEEKRIMALVKSTGDYFHGKGGKDEASRLFVIVRDFLVMLDKSCKEVQSYTNLPTKIPKKESSTTPSSPSQESPSQDESQLDYRKRLFPAIMERRIDDDFSSDDES